MAVARETQKMMAKEDLGTPCGPGADEVWDILRLLRRDGGPRKPFGRIPGIKH